MRTKLVVAVAGLALSLAVTAASLSAHHAFAAEFDANKPLTLKGTVTKMEWTNPHVWVHMDVKRPDGKVENWAFEAGTPNVLFRRGFTQEVADAGHGGGHRRVSGQGRLAPRQRPRHHIRRRQASCSWARRAPARPYELNQKPDRQVERVLPSPAMRLRDVGRARRRHFVGRGLGAAARVRPALRARARVQRRRRPLGDRPLAAPQDDRIVGQRRRRARNAPRPARQRRRGSGRRRRIRAGSRARMRRGRRRA